ncbi:MAG: 1-deoxy-D-xylulose-5-phosphate reductoisomerase [Planctomycetaceae bacterium]|jgi:1-deoxy-D-xylulose-5-phosphate reductoisomerase|nr:1-deoxy-D-xylulose-5-phosphate reductoisomerase [Planctomycetaceae bacterium]
MMSKLLFPRRVAILGSSGSIGRNTLEVIAESEGRLEAVLLSVHRRTDILAAQIRQLAVRSVAEQIHAAGNRLRDDKISCKTVLPRWVVVTDELADRAPLEDLPLSVEIFFGYDALCELVRRPEIDIVLSAIVGSVGLTSTWSALETGKTVALANKESLVMGGSLITDLAHATGGRLIPVDSEHSAIMQALQSWRMEGGLPESEHVAHSGTLQPLETVEQPVEQPVETLEPATTPTEKVVSSSALCCSELPELSADFKSVVRKLILTASGGPFRSWTLDELAKVTVGDALIHPTWEMGKKITVDSATLMNKALEIIEARWFFGISVENIEIVIHPQSVVHSMVEFVDGSTLAQLSPPDMRLPIQLALNYPYRFNGPSLRLDWSKALLLEFYPPDLERFPALALGLEVAEVAGTAGAVVNAANETAVNAFLENRLAFQEIVPVCRSVLEHHHYEQRPTLARLLELDQWARKETEQRIG